MRSFLNLLCIYSTVSFFAIPWIHRLGIENIMIALPNTGYESADQFAWMITAALSFAMFLVVVSNIDRIIK